MVRRHQWISIAVIGGLAAMTLFCSNPFGSKGKSSGSNITISGTLAKGLAKTRGVADNADSIVAVPCTNGEFAYMNEMRNAKMNSDGTFSIGLPQHLSYQDNGQDIPVEWVLLLVNSSAATRFDRVLGFIALKDMDQSLIKMPVGKAKGDIYLDTLKQKGNEAQSGSSAADDTAKFNLTITQLKEMERTGKTLKLAQNAYANYHGDNGENTKSFTHGTFSVGSGYLFGTRPLSDAQNKELLPGAYIDTARISYDIGFVTFNRALYDYAQISSGAVSFDLYPPTTVQYILGDTKDTASISLVPITTFISTDPSKNPDDPTSGDPSKGVPRSKLTCWIPDDRSDPSGLQRFGFGSYKGMMPGGKWQLKKNTGEVTSEFDLGLGSPFDSTGKPVVYVPSVNVSVNASDNTVGSVTVTWYSWDRASNNYIQATDVDLLKNAVSWAEVHLMSNNQETVGEKIGFGVSGQGIKMPYELGLTMTAVPTNKFTYAPPLLLIISYRSAGQSFGLYIQG